MTSSLHEFSDNSSEADERQTHAEAQTQFTSPATEISHPGVPASAFQHASCQLLGAGNTMGQAAYPYPDPYYRSIFAPYNAQPYPAQPYQAQPMVQLQLTGIQQPGVPLPSDAVEEPVFVNAKQYHGIM